MTYEDSVLKCIIISLLITSLPYGLHTTRYGLQPTTRIQCRFVGAKDCKCSRDQWLNMISEARRSSRYEELAGPAVSVLRRVIANCLSETLYRSLFVLMQKSETDWHLHYVSIFRSFLIGVQVSRLDYILFSLSRLQTFKRNMCQGSEGPRASLTPHKNLTRHMIGP
jgi:hypothetical protein